MTGRRIPCVGAIVRDGAGHLLLVQRGHDPEAGRWSLPGGPLVGAVERPGRDGTVLDIRDYEATVTGGRLAAGDDAAAARWVAPADVTSLPLTTGLAGALRAWGVLDPE